MTVIDSAIPATAFKSGRQGSQITTIVIHHWGDPATNPTFDGTVSFFARGGKNTSAHYVVEAGRISQMVSDNDTAYHAGDWIVNLHSIGIECNPRASDADKATVAELVIRLRQKYGNLLLIGHRNVISTDCPGAYYPPDVTLDPWFHMPTKPVAIPQPINTKDEDMNYADVLPLYQHYIGRDAQPNESMVWFIKAADKGESLADIAKEISSAPEAIDYAITSSYQQYLGRTPSAGERAFWHDNHIAWNDIVNSVINSPEAKNRKV